VLFIMFYMPSPTVFIWSHPPFRGSFHPAILKQPLVSPAFFVPPPRFRPRLSRFRGLFVVILLWLEELWVGGSRAFLL
jgi:hypothetical protein